jgi:DNA invertase Pin-like site-specific DNA recombinase
MVRLVAYIRVSTQSQVEDGNGLDVQREAIAKWASANGHQIVRECTDEGVSGAVDGLDRAGLACALRTIHSGVASGIVVFKLDRLARDLIVQEQLLAEVRRLGAIVYSTSTGEAEYLTDDPSDPSRKLIRQVLGAVNEYERGVISLRLRMGRERKRESGGFAFGSPPFGLRAEARELVAEPSEGATVERILELRRCGASLRAISDELNNADTPAKRGGSWHPQTVSRVVKRFEGLEPISATIAPAEN